MVGDPLEEYKDVSDNMRHYANMRFAQLSLYFALSAGLIATVFGSSPPLADSLRFVLKLVGVVGSSAFGVMDDRAADYWHQLRRRAVIIEGELGFEQHTNRPRRRVLTATNAVRMMIWGSAVLWIVAAIAQV